MPERQASPGEVTSRPQEDAAENGHGTGAAQPDRAGGSDLPAPQATTVVQAVPGRAASGEPADDAQQPRGDVEGNDGAAGTSSNGHPANGSTAAPQAGEQHARQAPAGGQVDATGSGGAPNGQGAPRPAPSPHPQQPQQQAPKQGGQPAGQQGARQQVDPEAPTVRTPTGGGPAADESPTVRAAAEKPSNGQPQAPQPTQQLIQQPGQQPGRPGAQPAPGQRPADEPPTTAVPLPGGAGAAGPGRTTPPKGSWFASVDAEDTQVIPRMPAAARGPAAPQPPAGADDSATEVIPVTRVAAPAPPPRQDPPPDDTALDGRKPRRRRTLLVVSAVVGVLGLLYAGDLLFSSGSVPRGVVVAGVAVGGLPLDEAEQRLRADVEPRLTRPIPVSVGDATSEIDPVAAGLGVDWAATMAQAGEQPLNPITRITSFFTERQLGVATSADSSALNSALEELAPVVDREPVEGTVRFEGVEPQPVDPVPGQQLDIAEAAGVLQRDWASGGPVALPLNEVPATTTPDDVATAVDEIARPAVSAPVTFVGENNVRGTLSPEVVAAALSFSASDGRLVPELNQQAVQDALAPQMAASERPGRDATIDFSSGQPVVVPSQDGRGIDYQASLAQLLDVLTTEAPREITAVYADQPAKVTTEDLQALGNPQIIGEFTTGGFAPDSGVNIRRAAELINGIVVKPGETFSLDKATGPRTLANGYVEAGVIDNGQPSRGPAGGVSQVSTTLYNAAYFAGMTIVEHKAHSFYISRYPAGREATIATGAIDNRWRNDNPTPVLIRTEWTPRSVTVRIYGQRQFEVTGAFGPRTNPTQPNTVNIPPGKPCNPSNGAPGFTITDTRTLRNVSTGESRRETFTTKYNPIPRVVCG
jgi:vancomycin resistance protein YoaR